MRIGAKPKKKSLSKNIDFDSHLSESLKDPRHAAYFLAACLDDAINDGDAAHFSKAVIRIRQATGRSTEETVTLMHKHISPKDWPNVDENLSIILARILQELEGKNSHLLGV